MKILSSCSSIPRDLSRANQAGLNREPLSMLESGVHDIEALTLCHTASCGRRSMEDSRGPSTEDRRNTILILANGS